MKLFVYKTLFVFICIFVLFKFTIGFKIDEYEKKIQLFNSDHGRELIREKIREEIRKSLEKDKIMNPEDRLLIKALIAKIGDELK